MHGPGEGREARVRESTTTRKAGRRRMMRLRIGIGIRIELWGQSLQGLVGLGARSPHSTPNRKCNRGPMNDDDEKDPFYDSSIAGGSG